VDKNHIYFRQNDSKNRRKAGNKEAILFDFNKSQEKVQKFLIVSKNLYYLDLLQVINYHLITIQYIKMMKFKSHIVFLTHTLNF
jgi:hypothetical protein